MSGFWKPKDRILAFLLSFGAGSLIAAVSLDLVTSPLEKGHFGALALGAILGGLIYVALNLVVNHYGGFLRKASTSIYYFRQQRQKKFEELLSKMGRIDLFRSLPPKDAQKLAKAAVSKHYSAGTTLYRQNDPTEGLYIIESGEVELLDPKQGMEAFQRLTTNDAFGRMAFFTGAPHATVAVAKTDLDVWMLPRQDFVELLKTSPDLAEATTIFLGNHEVGTYLAERQGMTREAADRWRETAIQELQAGGSVQAAVKLDHDHNRLKTLLCRINRLPIFSQVPETEIAQLATRFFYKVHEPGHTFFHQSEPADRLYIIDRGEVVLVDPAHRERTLRTLRGEDAFGAMAFLTSAAHTVSAIAATETSVWVLRRQDFQDVLFKLPTLEHSVKQFLQQEEVFTYLQEKQSLDSDKAKLWVTKAVRNLDDDKFVPSAAEMAKALEEHHGASMAIWFGCLIDNIPEALVIGSSLIHSAGVSLSLLAGLFMANIPEALSSSVGMRQQGMRFSRILWLWGSLVIITGIAAAFGNLFFVSAPAQLFSMIEGIAAGSMLTMIAETMLPEAYFKGSGQIGLSTLLGFLAAIFCKSLEARGGH
jgi:CRP-like cAMP-binding protein